MSSKQSILSLQENCTNGQAVQGCSLRINAFYLWLNKYGRNIDEVSSRVGITTEEFKQNLIDKKQFTKEQIRTLVYLMGAVEAFHVIYFPSFRLKRKAYKAIFYKKMKVKPRKKKRRRAWQERQS